MCLPSVPGSGPGRRTLAAPGSRSGLAFGRPWCMGCACGRMSLTTTASLTHLQLFPVLHSPAPRPWRPPGSVCPVPAHTFSLPLQCPRVTRSSSRPWKRPGSPRTTMWSSPSVPTVASTSRCSATHPQATAGASWWTLDAPSPARPPGKPPGGPRSRRRWKTLSGRPSHSCHPLGMWLPSPDLTRFSVKWGQKVN